jgi:hypothetical protein
LLLSNRFKRALLVGRRPLAGNGCPQRQPTDDQVDDASRRKTESANANCR